MVLSFPPSLAVLSPHVWSQYRLSLSLCYYYDAAADSEQFTGVKVLWFTVGLHIHCYLGLSKDGAQTCLWWPNQGEQEETVTAWWMQVNITLAANSYWACYQLKPQAPFSLLSHVSFILFLCCYVFRSKFRPSHLLLLLLLSSTIYWVPTIYWG